MPTSQQVESRRQAGFTLIEVMIAVVILGLGLSSLFASQAGAIRVAQRARTTTVGTLLARCKMGEIEEDLAKKGWPGTNLDGRDECCVGATHDGFRCEWKVERIVLPDATQAKDENAAKDALKNGASGAAGTTSGATPSSPFGAPMGAPISPSGASPGDPMNFGIPVTGVGGMAGMGGMSGTAGDPMAAMVMQYTFPIMKPIIEEQVRRVTVSVSWLEGTSTRDFDLVQFIVNEAPMVLPETINEETEGTVPGAPGTGNTQNTGGSGPSTPPGGSSNSGGSSTSGGTK